MLWLGDPGLSGPRPDADVDGDLLTDTFKTAHGMNPLIADDYQADADKDGMSIGLRSRMPVTNRPRPQRRGRCERFL